MSLRSSCRVLIAASVLLVVGCNPPPKEPHDGAASASPLASASPSASASPLASASATPPIPALPAGACASDADCRLFSSYCPDSPCGCRALSGSEPDPACAGSKVRCFADPCMRKAAQCQSAKCVVTAK